MTYPCPGINPTDVLSAPGQLRRIASTTLPPWVTVCSYCDQVRMVDNQSQPKWVARKDYEREEDLGETQRTHGICPECYQKILLPVLAGLRRNPAVMDVLLATAE